MKCEPRIFKGKEIVIEDDDISTEPTEPQTVQRDDGCICPAEPPPPKKPDAETCKRPQCPYDPRFPNQNITKRCYFSFVDYQRCARLLGDYPGCNYFLVCYLQLCPRSWIDKWFRQMEDGTFPRCIYPPKPIIYPDEEACLEFPKEPPPPPPGPPC